jgi:hypothetical protein
MIVRGAKMIRISRKYSVNLQALYNHRNNHLSQQMIKAQATKDLLHSKSLADEISNLLKRSKAIMDKASKKGRLVTELAAIRETRSTVELIAKLAFLLHDAEKEEKQQPQYNWGNLSRDEMEQFRVLLSKLQSPPSFIDIQPTKTTRDPRKRFRRRNEPSESLSENEKENPDLDKEHPIVDLQEKYTKPRMDDEEFDRHQIRRGRMIRGS